MKRLALIVCLAGCQAKALEPAAATKDLARERMDRAIAELSDAHRECWALGCRDAVVAFQLDTAYAPTYLRLARQ